MKPYSFFVLMAALAMPALCQEAPGGQPQALTEQLAQVEQNAARIVADAQSLSVARMDELTKNAEQLSAHFDSARVAEMTAKAAAMADIFSAGQLVDDDLDAKIAGITAQFDSPKFTEMIDRAVALTDHFNMAFLQNPKAMPAPAPVAPIPPVAPAAPAPKARTIFHNFGGDSAYNAGTAALDQHQYDEAVKRFDSAILQEPERADGALYWKAYALNREGKRDEALAALAQLRRDYAKSAWINDAQALEAEVKQNSGQPASPAQEGNDDLKLMAINSLMNADAERAIPLVEGILKGSSAPNVKDRALFVLAQNKSPRAQQALMDFARGAGNPDLQLRAIQYVGMSGTKDGQQQLSGIYATATDTRIKTSILQSLMAARANDALLSIAKTEKDAALRATAVRYVASMKSQTVEGLLDLYNSGADAQTKREIVNGLTSRREAKALVDLARKESDSAMKRTIVERLSTMHDNKDAMDYMMELLK